MSRSRRKTPVFGITAAPSEREDKKRWHRRWRVTERAALSARSPDALEAHVSTDKRAVSNVWSMGKDGRQRWPLHSQFLMAGNIARSKGRSPQERAALNQRLLHKWMAK